MTTSIFAHLSLDLLLIHFGISPIFFLLVCLFFLLFFCFCLFVVVVVLCVCLCVCPCVLMCVWFRGGGGRICPTQLSLLVAFLSFSFYSKAMKAKQVKVHSCHRSLTYYHLSIFVAFFFFLNLLKLLRINGTDFFF